MMNLMYFSQVTQLLRDRDLSITPFYCLLNMFLLASARGSACFISAIAVVSSVCSSSGSKLSSRNFKRSRNKLTHRVTLKFIMLVKVQYDTNDTVLLQIKITMRYSTKLKYIFLEGFFYGF